MDVADHVEALTTEGRRFADAAERAPLDAPVPTCPEWAVRDLVRHLGGVHRWATGYVAGRVTEPRDVGLDEVVGTWPDDGELVGWFRAGHEVLVDALAAADPDLACWTFLRAPSPLAMWARRQCHETTVHRVDAEAAVGRLTPVDPRLAADGVDELLSCFVTRRGGRLRADPPRSLRVTSTDAPGDWLVQIGPDGVATTVGGDEAADGTVRGPAEALYLALWRRRGTDGLAVDGDPDVLALFLDRVSIRWS
jgi:uncharacterized protein (TIGR03083 family)